MSDTLLRNAPLVWLTAQSTVVGVVLHHSQVHCGPPLSGPAAVALTMLGRASLSLVVVAWNKKTLTSNESAGSRRLSDSESLPTRIMSSNLWKLGLLSVAQVAQLNCLYVAASNLDAATLQVTLAAEVVSTAIISSTVFQRRVTLRRWLALITIAIGLAIIHTPIPGIVGHGHASLDRKRGLAAADIAALLSGIAVTLLESVQKGAEPMERWTLSLKLSVFSVLPALVPVFLPAALVGFAPPTEVGVVTTSSLFANLNEWALVVIIFGMASGTFGSVAIPCWDLSLRSAAIACSTVLILISRITSLHISPPFFAGTILIVAATFVYSKPDRTSAPPFRGRPQAQFRDGFNSKFPTHGATSCLSSLSPQLQISTLSTLSESSTFTSYQPPIQTQLRDIPAPPSPSPPHTEINFGDTTPFFTRSRLAATESYSLGSPAQQYSTSGSSPRLSLGVVGSPHLRRSSATDAEPTTPEIGKVFNFSIDHLPGGPGDTPAWVSMGLPDSAEAGDVRRFV